MPISRVAATACLTAALLCGCPKSPPERKLGDAPDGQTPSATQVVPGSQAGSATNTSVPAANTVMVPAEAKPAEAASAGRTNSAMSRAQESSAMPLPGQNNDHSAPLSPEKPASTP